MHSFIATIRLFSKIKTSHKIEAAKKNINNTSTLLNYDSIKCSLYDNMAITRDPLIARVKIGGERWIVPDDYVVNEEYGVGLYVGIIQMNLTPARKTAVYEPCLVVQYGDAQVIWFQRIAKDVLFLFKSSDAGLQELNLLMDAKKWKKRKVNAQVASKKSAMDLMKMEALRNSFHRSPCPPDDSRYREFEENFAFSPTDDQLKCFEAIKQDMIYRTRPMDRLICGDVGFGKTEVAMRAIYRAVLANRQVAVLAPTKILASQHLLVLQKRMPGVRIEMLKGGSPKDSARVKAALANGDCQVVVGTHALVQPTVSFKQLGLVVVDEEQRFGVTAKERMKGFTSSADVLTLSATPIPRTLQMSMSGLRDMSLLNSPPKGRKEVQVTVASSTNDTLIIEALERELYRGGQVYVVVPFIKDMPAMRTKLESLIPSITCIEVHGQHIDDQATRIEDFTAKKANVLIATTVIENGIDLPNVNTILVFNADRFGMSQLYQLRGRVGRSPRQAYAIFLLNSTRVTVDAEQRLNYLQVLTALGSGYDLSRRDLDMRGYGTIFGSEQSGSSDVGIDLQGVLLQSSLAKLRSEMVLSVPDVTLKSVGLCRLQKYLPSEAYLEGSYEWETQLAKLVVADCLPLIGSSSSTAEDVEGSVRELFSASTEPALEAIRMHWLEKLQMSEASRVDSDKIEALLDRTLLRLSCRRLGIIRVQKSPSGEAVLRCSQSGLSNAKWTKLRSFAPQDIANRVSFMNSSVTTNDGSSFMILSNAFSDSDWSEDLISLVVVTATHVEQIFEEAFKSAQNSIDKDDLASDGEDIERPKRQRKPKKSATLFDSL